MTYFVAYLLSPRGMSEFASLFKLKDDNTIEMIPISIFPKKINNIYNDIYFVFVDSSDLVKRKSFIRTSLKPIWKEVQIRELPVNFYLYAFKLLQRNATTYHPSYKMTIRGLKYYVEQFVKESLLKYKINTGKEAEHYIVCVYCSQSLFIPPKYNTDIFISVYVVQPISKEEIIKIIHENESLLLWELV